jgi:hypothetical protein
MKRSIKKKLTLHRETISALTIVTGGKVNPTSPLSACVPNTACLGCLPDTTPNNGCMPSLEVPCEPVSRYC